MNFFDMNFIEKIIYCYEYVFYTKYTCFNCGIDFRMKKMEDDTDLSPACSYGCLMGGLCSTFKQEEIQSFKEKYGEGWKIKYIEFLRRPDSEKE
jgi:hypothetical protein